MSVNQQPYSTRKDPIMATMAELEQCHYEMEELYNLSEALVDTVESDMVHDPEQQIALVEPLIDEIGEAADVLCEEFVGILEGKRPRQSNSRIESALRRVYVAIDAYHKRVDAAMDGAKQGFRNIADPIVKKLTRQMEVIVAALIDFVDLSLDRIMSHSYAEELRKRQEKIAHMLHNIGQTQGAG